MNNLENKSAFIPRDDSEEKERKYLEKQARKQNTKTTREFESNARKIRLGIPYTITQIEFFFDVRFNDELLTKLRDKFEFTSNENGSIITFNKIK